MDEYKEELQRLRSKILSQTAAIPALNARDVEQQLTTHAEKSLNALPEVGDVTEVGKPKFARWKFAFRDISKDKAVSPTMIRTRAG